ncbi:MAG TPA: (d)CMP kinase [Tenuifilaceae bacterium]|nr:(d)CMP kinase [Tenuifilaceae bacterium]HOZ15330.1 (d)CMP kinase [Tenuifilaceae bacterium]HPI45453.1 (d)CMP kinase [Tenuifilaceae bacterium]HPN22488.1 (d)CMP kinase [Tenuifilaceae bacterium]
MNKSIVIAVDGFSSCGKSTFAKQIAKKLNYLFIDSGAMYRAVTLAFIQNNIIEGGKVRPDLYLDILSKIDVGFKFNEVKGLFEVTLAGVVVENEIRKPEVANLVSVVAAIPEVRERMVELQRKLGEKKGIVMDGRDIGTVVFPDAELKIFMTADPVIRAERRLKELLEKGINITLDEVLSNIKERDHLDQTRDVSPLQKAHDAIVLDNSHMTVVEQMNWVENLVKERIGKA